MDIPGPEAISRRGFLRGWLRAGAFLLLGGLGGALWPRRRAVAKPADPEGLRWQIDPKLCIQCGRCATACVLRPSAVKCVHAFDLCGYCDLCFGYYRPGVMEFDTAAEKQLCPVNALRRRFIEAPYFEYEVDEGRCVGCARCVKGCTAHGNGSLYLQIRHDRCVGCNRCAIADACPSGAIRRTADSCRKGRAG